MDIKLITEFFLWRRLQKYINMFLFFLDILKSSNNYSFTIQYNDPIQSIILDEISNYTIKLYILTY